MANYVKVGPFSNAVAPAVNANFLNKLENVLIQPSGGSESGQYSLNGNGNVNLCVFGQFMQSLSRTTVPVSVTIDTSLQAPVSCSAPTTDTLTMSGFHVKTATSGGGSISAYCSGNFTINF